MSELKLGFHLYGPWLSRQRLKTNSRWYNPCGGNKQHVIPRDDGRRSWREVMREYKHTKIIGSPRGENSRKSMGDMHKSRTSTSGTIQQGEGRVTEHQTYKFMGIYENHKLEENLVAAPTFKEPERADKLFDLNILPEEENQPDNFEHIHDVTLSLSS